MAQLQNPFNPMDHDPTQGGTGGLPVGEHLVAVKTSEIKPAKSGGGGYIQFDLEVIDGPSQGSIGAYRINLYNQNPTTVQIAEDQFSALCYVCGVMQQVTDTAMLHGIPFRVVVEPQKQKDGTPHPQGYTEVKRVKDAQGNEPTKQGPQGGGQANAGAFGGQQPQQQPQQPQGGFGGQQQPPQGQQPQGGFGGGQPQQRPQQQPQGGQAAPWGGQPQGGGAPQQQQLQQQPQQQQPQGGGWNQQPQQGGGAPPWQGGQ